MAAEFLPLFAVVSSSNKLSHCNQEPRSNHHIDERILTARIHWEWMIGRSGDLPATDGLKEKIITMIQQFLGFVSVYLNILS